MDRPTLILCVGIPGSGKTTHAEEYIKEHTNTVHLSSDKIRKELYGDEAIQGDPGEVFTLMQKRTIGALHEGQSVVYDATNITRKDRAGIIAVCPKFAKIECHIVWAPIETCIERDAARERTVGKEVIDRMLKRFQAPYYDEGFTDIFIYYSENFDRQEYTNSLVDEMNIPHDNPHHTLNVFDHCVAATRHIADKEGCGTSTWYAALVHDVGKPYVKSFVDSKNNPCEVAHFYQHQCLGAYMVYGMATMLPDIYVPEIAWLVSSHMDPFMNTKYYKNLPAYLKAKVDVLHEADRAAH